LDQVNSLRILGSEDDSTITVQGSIGKPVAVDGGGGRDELNFDDSSFAGTGTTDYVITGGQLVRRNRWRVLDSLLNINMVITPRNVEFIDVEANQRSNNQISIDSVSVPTYVYGGNAGNTFLVGPNTKNMSNISRWLFLYGGDGED